MAIRTIPYFSHSACLAIFCLSSVQATLPEEAHMLSKVAESDLAPSIDSLQKDARKFKVIIIGAGMAGMAAAKALAQSGITDIALLEARNYTGGRVHAVNFGTASPGVVEEGANWIHGVSHWGSNPVWQFAKKVKLQTVFIPGSCANVSGYKLFHANGTSVANASQRARTIESAFDCANKTAQLGGPDMSFRQALGSCGWHASDHMDEALEWEVGPANDILPPWQQSLEQMLPDPTYSTLGSDDYFVHDQRSRGYASIVDEMMAEAGLNFSDGRLFIDAEVVRIDVKNGSDMDRVVVRTADGRVFLGERVIVTLPLGVMQFQHSSLFHPPLPEAKAKALSAITMGNFTKIFAEWPAPFWKERGMQWLAAEDYLVEGMKRIRLPIEFHDLSALVPGFNVLFTYVVGEHAQRWEKLSDTEAAKLLVTRLQRLFPGVEVPLPSAFHMTRHGSDRFMRGAYSTAQVGVRDSDFVEIAAPVLDHALKPKIFFAGEHTCWRFTGFLHGAYESGVGAAAQVLETFGKRPAIKSMCFSSGDSDILVL